MVEVPRKDHGLPEVVEAKEREVKNLTDFDTFEEVADEGQKTVGSRWVLTKKEEHDGQKTNCKARIVAKGFHEETKPQADSPTAMRESVKPFLAIAANQGFELESVDIRAAFLQSKPLDRDVFIEPPKDLKKTGVIWKLKKPLYGLDDASRKFWLRMRELFGKIGLKTVKGDEAFYYRHKDDQLEGMILSHVDDFNMAGNEKFLSEIREMLKTELSVSKIERNKFRFTGVDIERTNDGITISMEEYAHSLEMIEEIRAAPVDELLTKIENKLYRKYTGKISWLAANTRPDLAIDALEMSKKNANATIRDLKKINKVLSRVKDKPCRVEFTRVSKIDDLMMLGVTDASHINDGLSTGGTIIMLGNTKDKKVVPISWRAKTIKRVCHSAKAAETRSMVAILDDSQFYAGQIEQLLYGKGDKKLPIKLFTDSKPLLESISSTHQVEEKMLRNSITDMKDSLYENRVESFSWLDGETDMVADVMTKVSKDSQDLSDIVLKNRWRNVFNEDNVVKNKDGEIRMFNRRNKK